MNVDTTYLVVKNHEGQYSIWEKDKAIPDGWLAEGFQGPKTACLDHITEVWDENMVPKNLQDQLKEMNS